MESKITLEELAAMMKRGFDQTLTKDDLKKGLKALETRLMGRIKLVLWT